MDRKLVALLLRLLLSVAGGWLLWRWFFPKSSVLVAFILAAIVLIAAYASEWLRKKN